MKLFGSGGNKKPKRDATPSAYDTWTPDRDKQWDSEVPEDDEGEYSSPEAQENDEGVDALIKTYANKKRRRRIIAAVAVLVLALVCVVGYSMLFRQPPVETEGPNSPVIPSSTPVTPTGGPTQGTPEPVPTEDPDSPRKPGTYTFLCIGNDDGNGNTDTILFGMLDTVEKRLNVVSIPRDTLVNVPWPVKKVNTIYYSNTDPETPDEERAERLMEYFRDIVGYPIDHYIDVGLSGFSALVDTLGGVWFDVPIDMITYDTENFLYMNIPQGMQLLNGENALMVMRHREHYPDADLGRIRTQQAFLMAVAKQLLQIQNLTKIDDLAQVFSEYVTTSLKVTELMWLGREFMKIEAEDITFLKMPGNEGPMVPSVTIPGGTYIAGASYVSTNIDEWLEMLNEYLNPWKEELTREHLSMLTYDTETGMFYSTNNVYAQ